MSGPGLIAGSNPFAGSRRAKSGVHASTLSTPMTERCPSQERSPRSRKPRLAGPYNGRENFCLSACHTEHVGVTYSKQKWDFAGLIHQQTPTSVARNGHGRPRSERRETVGFQGGAYGGSNRSNRPRRELRDVVLRKRQTAAGGARRYRSVRGWRAAWQRRECRARSCRSVRSPAGRRYSRGCFWRRRRAAGGNARRRTNVA